MTPSKRANKKLRRQVEGHDHAIRPKACNLLTEGMLRLRGAFSRDYLVELTENYPTGMGNAPAPEAYPRFAIGPGQRYSSKGAYIVKFDDQDPTKLELVRDWIIPD